MNKKIVDTAQKIISKLEITNYSDDHFLNTSDGIITNRTIYNWLQVNDATELCLKSNFNKLIQQIAFELEL